MSARNVCVITLAALTIAMGLIAASKSEMANVQKTPPPHVEARIDNFSFDPATLTVPVGTTVTWMNRDDIPHTAVSTSGAFKSKVLDTDESFSFQFTTPGTFPYFCSIHPKMTGKVIVH